MIFRRPDPSGKLHVQPVVEHEDNILPVVGSEDLLLCCPKLLGVCACNAGCCVMVNYAIRYILLLSLYTDRENR